MKQELRGRYAIDRPCSACSAGDAGMDHHKHVAPFRQPLQGPDTHTQATVDDSNYWTLAGTDHHGVYVGDLAMWCIRPDAHKIPGDCQVGGPLNLPAPEGVPLVSVSTVEAIRARMSQGDETVHGLPVSFFAGSDAPPAFGSLGEPYTQDGEPVTYDLQYGVGLAKVAVPVSDATGFVDPDDHLGAME